MKKKDADTPTSKTSESTLTKRMAVIISIDVAKKRESSVENKSPVTTTVAAVTAPAAITKAPVVTKKEMVVFDPILETRVEVDPAGAIVPVHNIAPTAT